MTASRVKLTRIDKQHVGTVNRRGPEGRTLRHMTAQPLDDHDPDDPIEILRILPAAYHAQFLAEYQAAVNDACHPEHYRLLHQMLRLWRLRAAAYASPGYEAAREAARTGSGQWASAADVITDWDAKVEAARRRRLSR